MTLKNSENARIVLYICRLEDVSFSLNEKKLLDFVTSERRKTIEQFYSDIDGRLSLYGGLIIRMGIERILGIPNEKQEYSIGYMQKPHLKGCSFDFSLSHTRNAVICGFSESLIGTDIEQVKAEFPQDAMICFTEKEKAYCMEKDCPDNFYRIWTRKEAYTKWCGRGFDLDPLLIATDLPGYTTWRAGEYMISVYSEADSEISIVELTTEEISVHFLKHCNR